MIWEAYRKRSSSTLRASALGLLVAGAVPAAAQDAVMGTLILEPPEEGTAFAYRGRRGPAFWGELDPDWTLCGNGTAQSPVDISGARRKRLRGPQFDYRPSEIQVLNNGHTVEFVYQGGSTLRVGRDEFEVLQFHFHTPSEHTLDGGANYPVEMHIVHRDARGELAVVAVMLREGERSRALPSARSWGQILPREPGVVYELTEMVDLGALLPSNTSNYRYRGSLTTPPCSQGVTWLVMTESIEVSAGQLRELREALSQLQFASQIGTNNRPTQALNGREIVFDRN